MQVYSFITQLIRTHYIKDIDYILRNIFDKSKTHHSDRVSEQTILDINFINILLSVYSSSKTSCLSRHSYCLTISFTGSNACLQFPMIVVATKADIKNERECESSIIKKWADAEKGIVSFTSDSLLCVTGKVKSVYKPRRLIRPELIPDFIP